ncbi:helix-turn-helix transcriptional regulator [Dyella sp. 20L07]|uniref:helix-turn-helix transcriptional regulator n=1 Tax=Dyella sp. 20L07 TaxID=3384240 RepID=UPI003D283B4E
MTVARLEIVARRHQRIAAAPFAEFSVIQVRAGCKRISNGHRQDEIHTGGYFAVAPGQLVHVENIPAMDEPYRATCLYIPHAWLDGMPTSPTTPAPWAVLPAERALSQAFAHVEQGLLEALHDTLLRHRVNELLAAIALAGFHPPLDPTLRLGERVRMLLNTQPSHDWRADDVAQQLAMSAATLRRRLADESTGFRDILEEVRLVHGLALVQGSSKPLQQVAAECGYDSPSRFSARFRERFGSLPSALRA